MNKLIYILALSFLSVSVPHSSDAWNPFKKKSWKKVGRVITKTAKTVGKTVTKGAHVVAGVAKDGAKVVSGGVVVAANSVAGVATDGWKLFKKKAGPEIDFVENVINKARSGEVPGVVMVQHQIIYAFESNDPLKVAREVFRITGDGFKLADDQLDNPTVNFIAGNIKHIGMPVAFRNLMKALHKRDPREAAIAFASFTPAGHITRAMAAKEVLERHT